MLDLRASEVHLAIRGPHRDTGPYTQLARAVPLIGDLSDLKVAEREIHIRTYIMKQVHIIYAKSSSVS
jgi:hypothetical protein